MISFTILIWLIIDLALFPNFWQFVITPSLKDLKYWQGTLLIVLFLPMVCGFMFYKLCAKLWTRKQ